MMKILLLSLLVCTSLISNETKAQKSSPTKTTMNESQVIKSDNEEIIASLVQNAQISLNNSNFYDETIDSWWHTKDYWESGVNDGVRSIILYTIIDTSQIFNNLDILLRHQFKSFVHNREVSSLLSYISHSFPSETLLIIKEIMPKYEKGMMIFNPYGDGICQSLYNKLPSEQNKELDKIIVQLLNKESITFNNWFPIFRLLVEYGQKNKIKQVLDSNQSKLKDINQNVYFNAIVLGKAKCNGFAYYNKLIKEMHDYYNNKSEGDQYRYYSIYNGLKAIQLIVDNSELSLKERNSVLKDLFEFKRILASNKHSIETIEKLEKELKQTPYNK